MSHMYDEDPPIKTKHASQEYRDGWERIFGEKEPVCERCGQPRLEWQRFCGAACSAAHEMGLPLDKK